MILDPRSENNCMDFVLSGHQHMNKWIYRCLVKDVITLKRLMLFLAHIMDNMRDE